MSVFDRLDKTINKLEGIDQALKDYTQEILETTEAEKFVVAMNQAQLDKGMRSDDTRIIPDYTERTVAIKQKKGQVTAFVNLKDKNDFRGNIKTDARNEELFIYSTDYKSDALQDKYSEKIFGLNNEHTAMLRNFLLPNFKIFLTKYIAS